jgi:hypothetical protein
MIKLIKMSRLVSQYSNYLKVRFQGNKLVKKAGDDKLVISLVLIAIGVVFCFIYRNSIVDTLKMAMDKVSDQISDMFSGVTEGGGSDT